jgi:hypothetical protein
MPSRKSNLWPFSRSRKAVSHKPARRSSMTVGEATRAAYRAGKASGDTGLFQDWLEKQGLSTRGNVLVRRLKMEYDRGVMEPTSAPLPAAPKKSVFRTVIHKGVKITPTEEGFVTALDSSEFETVTDAKRFIDAWKKNPTAKATARGTLKAYDDVSGGIYKYTAGLPSTLGHALLNPDWDQLIRQAETSHSVDELARLHKYAIGARHRGLQEAVETRANKMNISIAKLTAKHPRKWNGKKKNPQSEADALFESFHGKSPEETIEIREEIHEHLHLATLGVLRELVVDTMSGLRAVIRFEKEPYLASSEDGRQLYIEAGDQELDLAALKMDGEEWVRDRMVIGQFSPPEPGATERNGKRYWNLSYQTQKKFDDFELVDYQHDLGEESGVRPFLEYEPRNQHLYIAGGQYRIEQPLLEMSPGIEN